MSVDSKQIPITSPCPITLDREGLTPEDRRMHCAHCVKDVHLLSNMTEPEARELMRQQAGNDICVSYSIKKDGGIRFASPGTAPARALPSSTPTLVPASALTRQVRPHSRRRETAFAPRPGMAIASIGVAMLLAACTPHSSANEIKVDETVQAQHETQVVIPCEVEEIVEGGIEAFELVDEVRVDGGIKAIEIPPEPMVAGGLVARPVEMPPTPPVAEQPEVHTPPPVEPSVEPEVKAEHERHVRGRVAYDPNAAQG